MKLQRSSLFRSTSTALAVASILVALRAPAHVTADALVPNNALSFDGADDRIDGTNPNLPQGNAPRTFEAWIRPDADQGGTIFNYGTFAENTRAGMLYIGGRLYWVGELNDVQGDVQLRVGAWTHVAISYDGTDASLYVDGTLDVKQPLPAGPHETTGFNWTIGSGTGVDFPREPFAGDIDDVKVWSVARTVDEIRADMNAGGCTDEAGLVAHYTFDQGEAGADNASVTTLTDCSATGVDGTLANFALSGASSNWVRGRSRLEVSLAWSAPSGAAGAPPTGLGARIVGEGSTPRAAGPPAPAVTAYNVYASSQPNVPVDPAHLFATLDPAQTNASALVIDGGAYYLVTAVYGNTESGPSNEVSAGTPGPTVSKVKVKPTKIVATGSGFTTEVQLFVDGVALTAVPTFNRTMTKLTQTGALATGESFGAYFTKGRFVEITFVNSDQSLTTVTYHKAGG